MTYAIGSIVYGINFKTANIEGISHRELQAFIDNYGEREYSGSGEDPMYVGVSFNNIDECDDIGSERLNVLFKQMSEAPAKLYEQVQAKINIALAESDVPEAIKEFIRNSEPEVFVTWGSS